MMNANPENQQNENTEDQNRAEQKRILEERLAEIESRNNTEAPASNQEQESVPEPSTSVQEVAAPIVTPEDSQATVLASNDEIDGVTENEAEAASAKDNTQSSSTAQENSQENSLSEDATESVNHPVDSDKAESTEERGTDTSSPTETKQEPEVATDQSDSSVTSPDTATPNPETSSDSTEVSNEDNAAEDEEPEQEEDINNLPVEEIRGRLIKMSQDGQGRKVSKSINALYRAYDQHFQEERSQALARFIAEGGAEDDFEFHPSPAHKEVEQAMQHFRETRHREARQEEENKTLNLKKKRDLLERLRLFVESIDQPTNVSIKDFQAEWKAIGPVPNAEAQELWNSFHALLDMYYNNRSIHFELKELDRKRNLDAKTILCERAEALAQKQNINKALQELRHLHDEWKHIGPVPNDARDTIWNRFILASEQVHDRKKVFFEGRRTEELANLEIKKALLAEMEQFQNIKTDRINDWRDKTDQIQKLKERWDAAGLVPKENAEEVNKAFWSSYKSFFHNKNAFFKALDEEKMQNYRQKVALCEEAENLQQSEEWDSTKEKLIQLQKKWKTIGRVPDKFSDKIWNRFRSACNAFFDSLHKEGESKEQALTQQSKAKENFCEELSAKVADPTLVGTQEEFNSLHQKWQSLASEGRRNPKLEDRFQQLLAQFLDKVPELTPEQKEQTLFKLQLAHLKSSPEGEQKLYQKEQNLRREIQTLENDISTLNTNIEFFARSKNAEKLREEYQCKITEAESRINLLKRQLKALRA